MANVWPLAIGSKAEQHINSKTVHPNGILDVICHIATPQVVLPVMLYKAPLQHINLKTLRNRREELCRRFFMHVL